MHPLFAQPPSLEALIPVLVPALAAASIALIFFLLGRWLGRRKYAKAVRAGELQPSPSSTDSPLDHVDACPRPVPSDPSDIVFELIDIVFDEEASAESCDSASATIRFSRAC